MTFSIPWRPPPVQARRHTHQEPPSGIRRTEANPPESHWFSVRFVGLGSSRGCLSPCGLLAEERFVALFPNRLLHQPRHPIKVLLEKPDVRVNLAVAETSPMQWLSHHYNPRSVYVNVEVEDSNCAAVSHCASNLRVAASAPTNSGTRYPNMCTWPRQPRMSNRPTPRRQDCVAALLVDAKTLPRRCWPGRLFGAFSFGSRVDPLSHVPSRMRRRLGGVRRRPKTERRA